MTSITLSRVFTAVVSTILFSGISAVAQTGSQPSNAALAALIGGKGCVASSDPCSMAYNQDCKMSDTQRAVYHNKCLKKTEREESEQENKSCEIAAKDFKAANSKFSDSCKDAGSILNAYSKSLDADTSSGTIQNNCLANVLRCTSCAGGGTASLGNQKFECGSLSISDGDDDTSTKASAASPINDIISSAAGVARTSKSKTNLASMEEEIMECVPRSAEELKELRSSTNSSRTTLRELQSKALERQNATAEESENEDKIANREKDRVEEIQTKTTEAIAKVKEKLDNRTQELVSNWQTSNDNMEADLRKMRQGLIQAENAYTEAVANLDRGCHQSALVQVENVRKTMNERMSQSTLTAGNFNQLMGKVGDTNKQKFQKMADEFYKDCRADRSYKSTVDSYARAKTNAINLTTEEITALKDKQVKAKAQIEALKTADNRSALAEMQRLAKQMSTTLEALERDKLTRKQQQQKKILRTAMQNNHHERILGEAQQDFDEDNDRMRLIRRLSGGRTPGKEGSVDGAISGFRNAKIAADEVVIACCIEGSGSNPVRSQACASAKSFLGQSEPKGEKDEGTSATGVGESSSGGNYIIPTGRRGR